MRFGISWRIALALTVAATLGAAPRLHAAEDTANVPQPLNAQTPLAASASDLATTKTEIFPGTGSMFGPQKRQSLSRSSVTDEGDLTLNFINADVKDVAKAILGDYLKLNYQIGAGVQGAVTIQTSRPLKRDQALAVLDQTLRLNGMAVVLTNDIYKVVTIADAPLQSGPVRQPSARRDMAGYGIEVAPVKYINAQEMAKLLQPLAPTNAIVHVDPARNVLLIEGTEQERQTLLENIALFDTDWLAGMSFAIFTPANMEAGDLASELTQVLGGMNSPILGVVKLVPIDRLNAVLAISPQERYLRQLQSWVTRLDKPGQGSDRQIFVYHVQHGRASDLANTLGRTLFGDSNASQKMAQAPTLPSTTAQSAITGDTANTTPQATQISGTLPDDRSGRHAINITAEEMNNALVIMATPRQYATVRAALEQLDTAPLQVFLEAAIAEVTLTDNLSYGVQYFFRPGSKNQFVLSSGTTSAIAPSFPGFSYVFNGSSDIKIVLDALSNITHVEVLSSPQLMVLNNQTASLQVGDQVPIVTQQAVSTTTSGAPIVNSVQYQNTGVILKVTPRANKSGEVMLDITQEVSDVTSTTSSAIDSPTIQQRKITSSVAVQDGETVALGGLITRSRTKGKAGIPLVQEIPLLGALFRDSKDEKAKTELIVLITPHVIDNVEKARAITNELRRKLPAVQGFLGQKP